MIDTFSRGSKSALCVNQSGSSLIEALVALVILGFGLLAVGKLQITLADAIGTGRERIEASLLAQEELDRLRSFDLIEKLGGSPAYSFAYNEITNATSSQLNDSNYIAAFARGVRISENPVTINATAPDMKLVFVDITWANKQGVNQFLTLPSVIAEHDPADAAWLIACQTDESIRCGTKDVIKTPYNRSLRIPYPAKDLGGGKSAFAPPGDSTRRIVFNNTTGIIESLCTDLNANISDDVIANLTDGAYGSCTTQNGYLASGFITGESSGSRNHNLTAAQIQNISIITTMTRQGTPDPICFDDSTSATSLTPDLAISYACIIAPTDHDSNAETARVWSGSITLGFTGVTLGTSNSDVKVCRFSFDSDSNGTISNAEHPATYTDVASSLENQNFIVITGNCSSTDKEIRHQL